MEIKQDLDVPESQTKTDATFQFTMLIANFVIVFTPGLR